MLNKTQSLVVGLAIAAIILAVDQWSKYYIFELFTAAGKARIEITSFFNLTVVWNHGISFGMFAEQRQPLVLIIISLTITVILLVWLWRNRSAGLAGALGLVIGGALGNIIDRVRFGAVFDFLDFHAFGYHWPSFNVADGAIFIGVVVLCIHSMFFEEKKPKGGL